jgi:glutamine amidotransferase
MAGLRKLGVEKTITARVRGGAPVLGICVGMQVLFEAGSEHGTRTAGLGLVPGTVRLLAADVVPHMGWNTVAWPTGSYLAAGLPADARFYFVHSYAAPPSPDIRGAAMTEYGEPFVAAFEAGCLAATQFHPEKSGDTGAVLLRNWVRSL